MGMQVSTAGGQQVRPTMNVTPLVDIVLVLLIIFMVVTPLLTKQLWLHVPEKAADNDNRPAKTNTAGPPVVTIAGDGVLRVNQQIVQLPQLATALRSALSNKTDRVIFFDAADVIPYSKAAAVLDAIKASNTGSIAVLPDRIAQ